MKMIEEGKWLTERRFGFCLGWASGMLTALICIII